MSGFDFGLQLLDPNRMTYWGKRQDANFWIENASVEWNEAEAPFHSVARLTLLANSQLPLNAVVVGHDEKDVGRALGRHDARRPVRRGIQSTFLNHAAELPRRRRELFPADGRGGAGRTGCASDFLGWRRQGHEHHRSSCQQ
jgi:hypothetical protein